MRRGKEVSFSRAMNANDAILAWQQNRVVPQAKIADMLKYNLSLSGLM